MRGGILDCRCARRSARRQVGTKGWSYSDRTKGWALELNSTALAHHAQFAELDAHNYLSRVAARRLRRSRGCLTARQKSAEGIVGQAVGKASEALQGRKAEQQIGRTGNEGRRPERLRAASRIGNS